jgi:hypothetical protein
MAKIKIEIEDRPEGGVKITSDPNFETMMKIQISGSEFTSAHGYAFSLLNHARKLGKENDPMRLLIPRIGG